MLASRVGDRGHARGFATPGELTLIVLNALGSEGYVLKTLSTSRVASPESFFGGGARGVAGDPAEYAFDLAAVRASIASPSRTDPGGRHAHPNVSAPRS